MAPLSNAPMAKLMPIVAEELFFSCTSFSSATTERSVYNKEFPGITCSASTVENKMSFFSVGFSVGCALRLGWPEKDGCVDGDFDVEGDDEGMAEGCTEGRLDGWLLGCLDGRKVGMADGENEIVGEWEMLGWAVGSAEGL